jgi:hypothetical protein
MRGAGCDRFWLNIQGGRSHFNAKYGRTVVEELRSVVYIGYLHESFKEKQMCRFFSPFREIKSLLLSRSKKAGNSRQ